MMAVLAVHLWIVFAIDKQDYSYRCFVRSGCGKQQFSFQFVRAALAVYAI